MARCDLVKARFEAGDFADYPENVTPFDFNDPGGSIFEIYKVLAKRRTRTGQVIDKSMKMQFKKKNHHKNN